MTHPEEGRSHDESVGADQNPFALPEGSTAPSFTDPFEITESLPSQDHQVTEELDLGGQGVFDASFTGDEPTVDYGTLAQPYDAEPVEPFAPSVTYQEQIAAEPVPTQDVFEATLVEEPGLTPEGSGYPASTSEPEPTLTDLGAEDPYGYGAQDPYAARANPYATAANPYATTPPPDPYPTGTSPAPFDPYSPQPQPQPQPQPSSGTDFPQAFAAVNSPQTGYPNSAPYVSPYAAQDPYSPPNPTAAQQPYAQQTAWQQPPRNDMYPYQQQAVARYHQPKSKIAAALLAWFLGHLGVHNFYLGYRSKAITQLTLAIVGYVTVFILVGFIILPIVYLWGFIEFVMILLGAGGYDVDADGYPLNA